MRSRGLKSFTASEHGASAVDFALVVVPLLLIVFGIVEYGRLMWTQAAIQEAAMAAARCMGLKQSSCATNGSYSQSQTLSYVQTKGQNWSISIPTSGVTLNNSATCSGTSGFSQVTISFTFTSAVPLLLASLSDGVNIQAVACFPNQS